MAERTDERQSARQVVTHAASEGSRRNDDYPPEELTSETVVAVLGGSSRRGEWAPADITRAFCLCGSVDLDFTKALLPPGITEVQAYAVCGSAKILVPEGLDVEVTGTGLLGDFKQTVRRRRVRRLLRRTLRAARGEYHEDEVETDEDPPLLRVTGLAFLGSVKVITC